MGYRRCLAEVSVARSNQLRWNVDIFYNDDVAATTSALLSPVFVEDSYHGMEVAVVEHGDGSTIGGPGDACRARTVGRCAVPGGALRKRV